MASSSSGGEEEAPPTTLLAAAAGTLSAAIDHDQLMMTAAQALVEACNANDSRALRSAQEAYSSVLSKVYKSPRKRKKLPGAHSRSGPRDGHFDPPPAALPAPVLLGGSGYDLWSVDAKMAFLKALLAAARCVEIDMAVVAGLLGGRSTESVTALYRKYGGAEGLLRDGIVAARMALLWGLEPPEVACFGAAFLRTFAHAEEVAVGGMPEMQVDGRAEVARVGDGDGEEEEEVLGTGVSGGAVVRRPAVRTDGNRFYLSCTPGDQAGLAWEREQVAQILASNLAGDFFEPSHSPAAPPLPSRRKPGDAPPARIPGFGLISELLRERNNTSSSLSLLLEPWRSLTPPLIVIPPGALLRAGPATKQTPSFSSPALSSSQTPRPSTGKMLIPATAAGGAGETLAGAGGASGAAPAAPEKEAEGVARYMQALAADLPLALAVALRSARERPEKVARALVVEQLQVSKRQQSAALVGSLVARAAASSGLVIPPRPCEHSCCACGGVEAIPQGNTVILRVRQRLRCPGAPADSKQPGDRVLAEHRAPITALAFSPCNGNLGPCHVATGDATGVIKIWRVHAAKPGSESTAKPVKPAPVTRLALSPLSDFVAVCSQGDDKYVRVWRASDTSRVFARGESADKEKEFLLANLPSLALPVLLLATRTLLQVHRMDDPTRPPTTMNLRQEPSAPPPVPRAVLQQPTTLFSCGDTAHFHLIPGPKNLHLFPVDVVMAKDPN